MKQYRYFVSVLYVSEDVHLLLKHVSLHKVTLLSEGLKMTFSMFFVSIYGIEQPLAFKSFFVRQYEDIFVCELDLFMCVV